MEYKNARGVLPKELIEEIQKYVSGTTIYIPTPKEASHNWGECNGTREHYESRNAEILALYESRVPVSEISDRYFYLPTRCARSSERKERIEKKNEKEV